MGEHLNEQHWQPVFLLSKPIVSIHVCCSYIQLSRSKLHKTGDLQVGNWHVNANILVIIIIIIVVVNRPMCSLIYVDIGLLSIGDRPEQKLSNDAKHVSIETNLELIFLGSSLTKTQNVLY